MRLFSYCIPIDDGAAPNPFYGVCTLTICKPVIRRVAEIGDWVVGVGSKNVKGKDYSGKLIYAMKITNKMTLQEYEEHCKEKLPGKIPDLTHNDYSRKVGDCIYSFENNEIIQLPSVHNKYNIYTDLNGKNALISNYFYYFGDKPISIPNEYKSIIKQGQGHKSNANDFIKTPFILWLESQNFILNHLYGSSQVQINFNTLDEEVCATIRCKSSQKDTRFSTSKKYCK